MLPYEQGQHRGPQAAIEAAEPPPACLATDNDERPARRQGAAEMPERTVAADVDDDVVAEPADSDLLARGIEHVISAKGSDHADLRRAAHASDLGAERLGDLDREGPDTARCANDKDMLAGLDESPVADGLKRREG